MSGDGRAPFTVGLTLPASQRLRATELVDLACQAEQAGLDAVSIGEFATADAFALAASIATRTSHIAIETGVAPMTSRSAASLAMASNTVDELSGGRFTLGLGAGSEVVARFHRRDFSKPLAMVEETIRDIRTILAGGSTAEGFALRAPVRSIPLVIAAVHPRMVQLAVAEADGVYLSHLSTVGGLRATLAGLPEHPSGWRRLVIQHCAIGGGNEGLEAYRREVAGYMVVRSYRAAALAILGAEGLERAEHAYRSGGRQALIASIALQALAPMVLTDRGSIGERLHVLHAAGCDGVRIAPVRVSGDVVRDTGRVIDEVAAAQRAMSWV